MLVFKTPGEINPLSWKIFGVSAKESENPIGFFGTGLKYAIAIILRLGGSISISSNNQNYIFKIQKTTVRNKDFNLVMCNDEPLGFTTELGKTWKPWQAYRELESNTMDEKGHTFIAETFNKEPDHSYVIVDCEPILSAHKDRNLYFLHTEPFHLHNDCDIHEGPTNFIYYRGVAAHVLSTPSYYKYNIKSELQLTEDRTIFSPWRADYRIKESLKFANKDIIRALFWQYKDFHEYGVIDDTVSTNNNLWQVACEMLKSNMSKLNPSLSAWLLDRKKELSEGTFEPIMLTAIEKDKFERAKTFCENLGYYVNDYKVFFVETLGTNLGMANVKTKTIYITRKAFAQGAKFVAATLLEEILHIKEGLKDNSREMQNYLFDKIITLGEEKLGVSL